MTRGTLPKGVVALGFVSLFMDMSSEMIHSLLPLFMVTSLGVSALAVGVIEGIAEATASIAKVFSGVLSDWIRRRKPLVLLGYGMAALTKPLFPLADGISAILTARFLDRVGKGIRGAPRDALIADITAGEVRGAAYGLRQSMDTVGAFAGPLFAILLMSISNDNFRLVFWVAVCPALICVLLIIFGVEEPESRGAGAAIRFPLNSTSLKNLPFRFWLVVIFASLLTLARFSEAFLLLRAQSVGMKATWVPLILIVMNIVYAVSAYPLGKLSDNGSRRKLLLLGISFLILSDLVLAHSTDIFQVFLGAAIWGVHMGATQGLLSALVAGSAPLDLRGTAFGIFNLATGISLLIASVVAGSLWTTVGPAATFYAGAALSAISFTWLVVTPLVPGK